MNGHAKSLLALAAVVGVFLIAGWGWASASRSRVAEPEAASKALPRVLQGLEPTGEALTSGTISPKIASDLWAKMATGQRASFLAILQEQADLSAASALPDKVTRGRFVYERLRATALRTQAPLRAFLDAQGVSYTAHYLVNMLSLSGDRNLLLALASRPEVARLEANPEVAGIDPLTVPAAEGQETSPAGTEWGVRFVNAPDVWALYAVQGDGIVVGGQDTGYQWDHPAVKSQYRGWDGVTVNHDYNWHDAASPNATCPDPSEPCDDHSHGTHTIGTVVGDDGVVNQIGVAPGAQWIGCRNMSRGVGTPATYTECFEFLMAPYPFGGDPLVDGNPDLAAHIINNSWSCPPSEGCGVDTLRQVVENVRAGGIMVVSSAGNQGSSGCGSVVDPIAIYDASFSVGAVDSSGTVAGFSSRGPVTVDGSRRLKPDLSAPGVTVRSAVRGGAYAFMNGTSMASPHVAGVVALLWSAEPRLVGQVNDTEYLLTRTAQLVENVACGSEAWPNYTYGWGYVDALAAVQAVLEPARVQGQVMASGIVCTEEITRPVPGAVLTFSQGAAAPVTITATAAGAYSLTLPPGEYTITAAAPEGHSLMEVAWLLGNRDNEVDFTFQFPAQECELRRWFLPLM